LDCSPPLLAGVDALARETAAVMPGANAEFSRGLYWSEATVAGRDAAFFNSLPAERSWDRDVKGFYVPRVVARAEAALLRGEELSPLPEQADLSLVRAVQLLNHARLLATKKLDHSAAAQWRFLEVARLGARNGHAALASKAWAWLSHLLMRKGQQREALDAATNALAFADEPLAQYLQVTLLRALGELTTTSEVEAAEMQLAKVAGLLPSAQLESERAKAHAEMVQWGQAAHGGGRECMVHGDIAKVMLCFFCKLVLP